MVQDLETVNKLILYIALVISILTYFFWEVMFKNAFYIGNALFILMLCTYLYQQDKKSFIKFCLFNLSLTNFLQEIFNKNITLGYAELLLIIFVPLIWYIRNVLKNDD